MMLFLSIEKKRFCRLLLACLFCSFYCMGQDTVTLSVNEVFAIVRQYNPIARQAGLLLESARAEQLSARGNFDPEAYVGNEQKDFSGTSYFFHTDGGIKIPTWYGIELKAGFENNGGERIFEELTGGKSSFAGISMPLLKGLMLDKRRAVLKQAGILINQSEADRRNAYNDLLFDAADAYWQWVQSYKVYLTISQVVATSQRRFSLVKRSFVGGDLAAIDTVESLTQLQAFQLLQNDAFFNWRSAGFELSNFLWLQNNVPYTLGPNVIPDSGWQAVLVDTVQTPVLDDLLTQARQRHPKLQSLGFKQNILSVERRLKAQSLLPTLNVSYNFLNKGYQPFKGVGQNFFNNNYKYGFDFKMPLFLRQARGDLSLADIKLRGNELLQDQTSLEIENKVKTYFTQVLTLQQQVALYEAATINFQQLLNAEEVKFSIGESSLFLVNSRENKLLEARQKLIELKTKFFKAQVALLWAAGLLL